MAAFVGGPEEGNGPAEPFTELDARLPAEDLLSHRDVRLPDLRVVLWKGERLDRRIALRLLQDHLGELPDGELVRVADVVRVDAARVEEPVDALDLVVDVAEGAGLAAIAIQGQRIA